MNSTGQQPDVISELQRYAAALFEASGRDQSSWTSLPDLKPIPGPIRRLQLRTRVALLATILVGSNVGLAAASDSAVPGDILYPIDRAYESVSGLVGIETGGIEERMSEAVILLTNGDLERAIATATEALPDTAQEERGVLDELASELTQYDTPNGHSGEVQAAVAALLQAVQGLSEDSPPGHDKPAKDEFRAHVRSVAEAARGRPFAPDQGPGTGQKGLKKSPETADSNPTDIADITDDSTRGNGHEQSPARGNAPGRKNAGNGANGSGNKENPNRGNS